MTRTAVGYVGLDHHHSQPYLESLEQLPVSITCACDPAATGDTSAVDGLDGVPVYRDPETLLASEDVDAVWLTVANRDTPDLIRAAVDEGVDVFTEKPAARTAAELAPVADRVRDADASVMVSYPWRAHPIAQELRDRVESDFFGTVRSFDTRFVASALEHRDPAHYLYDGAASRGGILQWLGVHWLDLVQWVLDDRIERVHAVTRHGTEGVDVEDGAILKLETNAGAVGSLQCGYYLREGQYDTRVSIYGTDGWSNWDPMGRTFGFDGETTLELDSDHPEWCGTPRRTITHEYESADGYGGAWGLGFIEQFFEARDGSAQVPVTLDDALDVLRVLDAAYESAATGEWVSVETQLQSVTGDDD